ncbi:MAG TPA: DNA-formamidopyrimidine glycosylase family protein, partial [Actinomycetota bacterium]|nr:DNA-formamidopyrimidine glycosylase family protein [Actinomycetota bacterium]
MPELPEIQALAERIEARLVGARLRQLEPLSFSALKTVTPSPADVVGKRLTSVGRRGKYLILGLESVHILLHLSQGGRIDFLPGSSKGRPKGGVLRVRFDRDPVLLVKEFGTERKAGWWLVEEGDEWPLAKLGPDPFSDEFRDVVLSGDDSGRLHSMLRDQRRVAGIGRGYADDILHRARLSPFRSLSS